MASCFALGFPELTIRVKDSSAEQVTFFRVVFEVNLEDVLHVGRICSEDATDIDGIVEYGSVCGVVFELFGCPFKEALLVFDETW